MKKIKIVIVEDMVDIAQYFAMILNRESDTEVLATAYTGSSGVEMTLKYKPDIVLMDIQMEYERAGIDAIEKIKEKMPEVKIIVLTVNEDDDMLFSAMAAGASEYIIKNASIAELLKSIHMVYNNQLSLRPDIATKILNEFSRMRSYQDSMLYMMNIVSKLTTAEFEVLLAFNDGKTTKQVAEERHVEPVTIRTQINKILKKFDAPNIKTVVKKLQALNFFEAFNGK